MVAQVIPDGSTCSVSITLISLSLIISVLSVIVEEVDHLIHVISQGASNNPGDDCEDHKEYEVLNGLNHINWGAKGSLVHHHIFTVEHFFNDLRSIPVGFTSNAKSPEEEP